MTAEAVAVAAFSMIVFGAVLAGSRSYVLNAVGAVALVVGAITLACVVMISVPVVVP